MNNIWLAFVTGLTTGGISCLAVQGGLLASAISGDTDQDKVSGVTPSRFAQVGAFIAAKIFSHMVLGFALGLVGLALLLTPKILGLLQIFAGLFMIVTALRIANIHPIFRYFVIQPPKWSYKLLRKTSKSGSVFAPLLLGLFSILMPCGITQAMMVFAVASGNPVIGALIMGAFVLGTSPLFFALGAVVVELLKRRTFAYIAAVIVGIMGVASVNGGLVLRGSIYTLQNFYKAATTDVSATQASNTQSPQVVGGYQNAVITVTNRGYTSDIKTLKVNVPVKLKLVTNNVGGCSRAFTIPDYNISKVLPATGVETVEFTPKTTGRLAYSCSMGMYTGDFTVIP